MILGYSGINRSMKMVDPHRRVVYLYFIQINGVSTGPVKCLGLLTVLLRFCFVLFFSQIL